MRFKRRGPITLLSQLNQLVVTDSEVVVSPNAASLESVIGRGRSLLQAGSYQQVADCLGDVVVAVIIVSKRSKIAARVQVSTTGALVRRPAGRLPARRDVSR